MTDQPLFDFSNDKNHASYWSFIKPEQYNGMILAEAQTYTLTGGFGYCHFQSRIYSRVAVWMNSYLIYSRMKGRARLDLPMIEISFVLGTQAGIELNSLGRMLPKGWQFNIVYDTHMDAETQFEKGSKIVTVDIHYHIEILEAMCEYHPDLFGPLLEHIHAGRPMKYFPKYVYASYEMVRMFRRLLRILMDGPGSEMQIENLAASLLLEGLKLKHNNRFTNMRFDYVLQDKRIINSAIKLLDEDGVRFMGNEYYAGILAMGATRLKSCVFDHTGATLKANWKEKRIFEAIDLLINTKEGLSDIVIKCGFSSIVHFNRAIYNYVYMEPWELRNLAQGGSWSFKKDRR